MSSPTEPSRGPGRRASILSLALTIAAICASIPSSLDAQWAQWRERDRGGAGIPVSMFGTYVERGDLIVYPFFEYYRDSDAEYDPADFGYAGTEERFGKYRASEGLLFLSYGISERWALEFEAAIITARLEKDPNDTSAMPAVLEQSGLGDVEGQIRYRWRPETEGGAEIFSYLETVLPLQTEKLLIGTPEWEFKLGTGVMRTWAWGTMTVRGAVAYAESKVEVGEYAVEYVRGLGEKLRLYVGAEGSEDEIEAITEAQIHFTPNVVLKLNSAFGVTKKATDWAPEIGLAMRF